MRPAFLLPLVHLRVVKMKRLLDWLLLTNVYTACCAVALCMATERLVNGARPDVLSRLHALVFGCSLLVYNIHPAIKKRASDKIGLPRLTEHHQLVFIALSAIGVVIGSLGLQVLSPAMVVACGVLGFISFAYTLPILPFKNRRRIRDIGWLKILSLTSVWTIVTSVLPILFWKHSIADYPLEIVLRGLFIFTLCIIFDIRDMQTDSLSRINTLPRMLGLRNTYMLMNALLLAFVGVEVLQYLRHPLWYRMLAVIITAILTRIVARYLKNREREWEYILYADGLMLLYSALVLLL